MGRDRVLDSPSDTALRKHQLIGWLVQSNMGGNPAEMTVLTEFTLLHLLDNWHKVTPLFLLSHVSFPGWGGCCAKSETRWYATWRHQK